MDIESVRKVDNQTTLILLDGEKKIEIPMEEVTEAKPKKIFFGKNGKLKSMDTLYRDVCYEIFLDPDIQHPIKHRARYGVYLVHIMPWKSNNLLAKKYMKGLELEYILSYNENKLYKLIKEESCNE